MLAHEATARKLRVDVRSVHLYKEVDEASVSQGTDGSVFALNFFTFRVFWGRHSGCEDNVLPDWQTKRVGLTGKAKPVNECIFRYFDTLNELEETLILLIFVLLKSPAIIRNEKLGLGVDGLFLGARYVHERVQVRKYSHQK